MATRHESVESASEQQLHECGPALRKGRRELARELRRSNLRYGIASACIGGGQGIALLLENPR
ncbi:MAG TPA: hypothetical protein VGR03_16890 [Candidatus Acidoferrum sp.]|nr:hypothetical protein [Candidatus Acidoferrum sp.]